VVVHFIMENGWNHNRKRISGANAQRVSFMGGVDNTARQLLDSDEGEGIRGIHLYRRGEIGRIVSRRKRVGMKVR